MAVGPRQLYPQRRKRLRERSRRRAERQMRPQERQTEREIGRVQRQTGRRASRARQGALSQQRRIGRIDLEGLQGRYLREAEQSLAADQQFLGRAAQVAPASIQRQGRRQVRDMRRGQRQDTVALARQHFEDMKQQALQQRQQRAERQAEVQQIQAETNSAIERGLRLLEDTPVNWLHEYRDSGFRDALATDIARVEGIGTTAARRAVRRIYRDVILRQIGGEETGRTPTELGQTTLTTPDLLRRR